MGYFDKFHQGKYENKKLLGKIWHFIWHEDSWESWIINIILAFVVIKFLIYPGLGFAFGTSFPIVAVVSGSMSHDVKYDIYWERAGFWYDQQGITKEIFLEFPMHNGFNKGDIMLLYGTSLEKINVGDVIVFKSHRENPRSDPIIHRVVNKDGDIIQTKGDNYRTNPRQINTCTPGYGCLDETDIREDQIIGKAFIRVPFLGYVKIIAVEIACVFGDFNFCIDG